MAVAYGPVNLFVFGFDNAKVKRELKHSLLELSRKGLIRILDIAYVSKSQRGNIEIKQKTELDKIEQMKLGAAIGGLIGLGVSGEEGMEAGMELGAMKFAEKDFGMDSARLTEIADTIPVGSSVAVLLVEYLWLKRFKDEFMKAGGTVLAQAPVSPEALISLGMDLAATAEAIEEADILELEDDTDG